MLVVPIQAVPNQTFSTLLGGQSCQITLATKLYGLYFSLSVNNVPVVTNIVCENLNRLIRYEYLGFIGDFQFADTQGTTDPVYSGFGARYFLEYLEASDLVAAS